MTSKSLQALLPRLLRLRHEVRLRKDKSGSHGASSNKGTLTYSNTDVMPNESIFLCEGFLGSKGTDSWAMFSPLCHSGAQMKVGGNFVYILQVGV